MKLDVKVRIMFSKQQLKELETIIVAVVGGEVTRQLKFKRNEVLKNAPK